VGSFYQVSTSHLTNSAHGKVAENLPRKVAVYLCQETTGATLRKIAEVFNLGHYRSASYITHEVRVRKKRYSDFSTQLLEIMKMLL
jgi:putative transposase